MGASRFRDLSVPTLALSAQEGVLLEDGLFEVLVESEELVCGGLV